MKSLITTLFILLAVCLNAQTIELVDYTINTDECTSTWTYNICADKEISHITFGVCEFTCLQEGTDNWNTETTSTDWELEYGDDPTTGLCGIKYEEPAEQSECEVVTFTLSGFTELGEIEVGVKAGSGSEVLTVPGPTPILDCDCSALPVELGGIWIKDDILYWFSYTEIDFDHYAVEVLKNSLWSQIGAVEGGSGDYQYNLPETEKDRLYRLKMVDLDGSYNYSGMITHRGTEYVMRDSRKFDFLGRELDVVYPMQIYVQDGQVKINKSFEIIR